MKLKNAFIQFLKNQSTKCDLIAVHKGIKNILVGLAYIALTDLRMNASQVNLMRCVRTSGPQLNLPAFSRQWTIFEVLNFPEVSVVKRSRTFPANLSTYLSRRRHYVRAKWFNST